MDRSSAHRPVLPAEVLELLQPADCGLILDCTVGAGGHAEMLLDAAGPQTELIGIDRDEGSLRLAKSRLERFGGRVRLFKANFSDAPEVLAEAAGDGDGSEEKRCDVLLADLGVASMHLDDSTRGFSFQADGPLDMRMDVESDLTAEDIVNTTAESQLADMIYQYGQERYSRRIAHAIVAKRKVQPINSTSQLARIVAGALPAAARHSRRGVHPATRTFQAIRIVVNDELGSLDELLASLGCLLSYGGRAGFISFHSLEDRRVKQTFAELARLGQAELLTKKPVAGGSREQADNPRSRSAKLRGIRWIENRQRAGGSAQ